MPDYDAMLLAGNPYDEPEPCGCHCHAAEGKDFIAPLRGRCPWDPSEESCDPDLCHDANEHIGRRCPCEDPDVVCARSRMVPDAHEAGMCDCDRKVWITLVYPVHCIGCGRDRLEEPYWERACQCGESRVNQWPG